jgi:hypothetical protein
MTVDHAFTDGLGVRIAGRAAMRHAWATYFAWMPDYRVEIDLHLAQEGHIALFGWASGTYAVDGQLAPVNRWRVPAAWRAVVRGDRVSEWQVYCDNKPVYEIMARAGVRAPDRG